MRIERAEGGGEGSSGQPSLAGWRNHRYEKKEIMFVMKDGNGVSGHTVKRHCLLGSKGTRLKRLKWRTGAGAPATDASVHPYRHACACYSAPIPTCRCYPTYTSGDPTPWVRAEFPLSRSRRLAMCARVWGSIAISRLYCKHCVLTAGIRPNCPVRRPRAILLAHATSVV
jgi:hypothetical protein